MKLLILTQKVDRNDGVLGFFHRWIEEFAKNCEKVTVICLYKGENSLPNNVKLLSLGKEKGESRFKYIYKFYKYIWKYRNEYDGVFIHMNQEYVFLGFFIWRILNKRFFLWRNHFYGNFLTNVACFFCDRTFCTSKFSYINKFHKNILMPVGIDTNYFKRLDEISKNYNNILFVARISPSKKLDQLIEALNIVRNSGVNFHLTVLGNPLPVHNDYYKSIKDSIKKYNLESVVEFVGEVPNYKTVDYYNKCKLYVNLAPSGCFDKTIFESMSCEALVLTCNKNLINEIPDKYIFEEDNIDDLSKKIIDILNISSEESIKQSMDFRNYTIKNHSLELLVRKLLKFF